MNQIAGHNDALIETIGTFSHGTMMRSTGSGAGRSTTSLEAAATKRRRQEEQ
jgi:hypothetical protein